MLANQADLIKHTFVLLEMWSIVQGFLIILNTNDVLLTGYNFLHLCFSAKTKCKFPKIAVSEIIHPYVHANNLECTNIQNLNLQLTFE